MTNMARRLLASGSGFLALAWSTQTIAQDRSAQSSSSSDASSGLPASAPDVVANASDASNNSAIVVTASRLGRSDVPTPQLTVDAELLTEATRANVVAALNDLPQFKASWSPQITGGSFTAGSTTVDLRGLGSARTLVLINGRRFASAYGTTGFQGPDLAVIPSIILDRVDVVTGSASAAWGSNAVAGVVNLIPLESFDGIRLGGHAGVADRGDVSERQVEALVGVSFADGRANILVGGEYIESGGPARKISRTNVGRWSTVTNPNAAAGQAALIFAPDVGFANASYGGLILTGVNSGRTFNPDGTLRAFDFGRVSGVTSIGGEGPSNDDLNPLVAPYHRYSVMGRASYDVTDNIAIGADALHSRAYDAFLQFPDANRGNITISRDNAFLPAAIRNQMVAVGETSFTLGRFNADYARGFVDYSRKTTQLSAYVEAGLSDSWSANAYYTYGSYDEDVAVDGYRITANFNRAADSLVSPTNGQPICRVALTTPSTDCVPINLFGYGAPSAAARAYVTDVSQYQLRQTLQSGGITVRGETADLWAGPISVALGAEARREELDQTVGSLDQARAFAFNNFTAFSGANSTREAFAEILLPLLRDLPAFQSLKFNGAARLTDDRLGSIWSWKLGLLNTVADGVQLRFTHSRDIRSPNLVELYSPQTVGLIQISDPQSNTTYQTRTFTGGNPNLVAETSLTTTAGLTVSPRPVPGLSLSVDYFDIKISNAIATITAQNAINLCQQGFQSLCDTIVRGPNGLITEVSANQANFARISTAGIDVVLDYTLPLGEESRLRFRTTATRATKYKSNNGLTTLDLLGSQGTVVSAGVPKLSVNSAVTYEKSGFAGTVRARYIAAGLNNRTLVIENNRIPAFTYVDLGARYRIGLEESRQIELFANINNLLDKNPPVSSSFSPYYDVVGRYFIAGARVQF